MGAWWGTKPLTLLTHLPLYLSLYLCLPSCFISHSLMFIMYNWCLFFISRECWWAKKIMQANISFQCSFPHLTNIDIHCFEKEMDRRKEEWMRKKGKRERNCDCEDPFFLFQDKSVSVDTTCFPWNLLSTISF